MSPQVSWYPSKVDWWLGVLLVVPLALIPAWIAAVASGSRAEMLAMLLATVLVVGILVGLVFPMRYGIGEDTLLIRFGLCRLRVDLRDIIEVEPSRNPLASPALSMDRLIVRHSSSGFGYVLISPAERDRFLEELSRRSGMRRDGDRLFRI